MMIDVQSFNHYYASMKRGETRYKSKRKLNKKSKNIKKKTNKCDESPIERADSNATSVPNRQLKLRLAKLFMSTSTICDKMKEFKRKTYAFFMPDNFSHDRFT